MSTPSLLVIVPHPDDELIIAGPLIYAAVRRRVDTKVVFVTNGDYYAVLGPIRMKEAMEAMAVLGLPQSDVIFLGYGDQYAEKHIYHGKSGEIFRSHAGRTCTYGIEQKPEFSYATNGEHHSYTRDNYKGDIKSILSYLRPDIIVTTGWDWHADHIALSLTVDECVGELLHELSDYCPLVLKSQAYTGKWEGKEDYYEVPNVTCQYNAAFGHQADYPLSKWEDRICFAVPEACKTRLLKNNILYWAARKYRSQDADLKALAFINEDAVYWRRHTESLTYHAQITVSSGQAEYLNDFKCADCSDILMNHEKYDSGIWIPEVGDEAKEITIKLGKPELLKEVHLYENPNKGNNINNMLIYFGDRVRIETGELNHDGSCSRIVLPEGIITDKIVLKILDTSGWNAGLTEIEMYSVFREIDTYSFPLSTYRHEKNKKQSIWCLLERLCLKTIKKGRGRFWPNRWLLLTQRDDLTEESSVIKLWISHMKWVYSRVMDKMARSSKRSGG